EEIVSLTPLGNRARVRLRTLRRRSRRRPRNGFSSSRATRSSRASRQRRYACCPAVSSRSIGYSRAVTGSGQSVLTPHSGPEHSITTLWWVMFGGACVGLTVITTLLLLGWIRRNRASLPFGGSERAATRLVVGLGI